MHFEQKIQEAYSLGLFDAVTELVYNAVKSGYWSHIINRGFDPKIEFSEKIYYKCIHPAVIMVIFLKIYNE